MKKIFTVILLVTVLIIPQLGCKSQQNNYQGVTKTGFYMDTVCQITIYSMTGTEDMGQEEQEQKALSVITGAFKLCDEYEKRLSKTIEGSEIYRINHAAGEAVEVDETTIEVIEKGMEYGRISGGNFDITIGQVTDLWDFHEQDEAGEKTGQVPDKNEIEQAVSHVDYEQIIIQGNTVRLADPQAEIDLGGIAKGYVADRVGDYMEEQGVTSAVISLGGNIVVIGEKGVSMTDSQGNDFSIGIRDPQSDSGDLAGVLRCSDKTVVTSGTYERYFEADGIRYHHILDPETGYPFDTDVLSVTIIADKGRSVDCDGLSTTCLTLGTEKGMELIRSMDGIEAVFIDTEGQITLSDDSLAFEQS